MQIRKTKKEELPILLAMYEDAREFMRRSGNPDQWGTTDPPREKVEQDIAAGQSYVCEEDGRIAATFFFAITEEPNYARIEEGSRLDDTAYGVIHRITTDRKTKGAAGFCLEWAIRQAKGHLRIDTHEKNLPMQRLLQKHGFTKCGTIYVEDGSMRRAYEKISR